MKPKFKIGDKVRTTHGCIDSFKVSDGVITDVRKGSNEYNNKPQYVYLVEVVYMRTESELLDDNGLPIDGG